MIERLCQTYNAAVGKSHEFVMMRIPSKNGRQYVTNAALLSPMPMSLPDTKAMRRLISYSGEKYVDRRSVSVALQDPGELKGLRLKGIYPFVAEKGQVANYVQGSRMSFCPLEDGAIAVREKAKVSGYDSLGTMFLAALEREIVLAAKLGSQFSDTLLGFGEYEGLSFNGQPVGFVIYGMETDKDIRLFDVYRSGIGSNNMAGYVQQSAKILAYIHKKLMHSHGFPHVDNFRFLGSDGLKAADFDNSVNLLSVPTQARIAFVYLDLARAMAYYSQYFPAMIPMFLDHYFGENNIAPIRSADIMQPIYDLARKSHGARIDLKEYLQDPAFARFYAALERMVLAFNSYA